MARRPATWWAFGITLALALALIVAGSLHVALRWEPRLLGEAQHGEWMEFETFRIRVNQVRIADSFPARHGDDVVPSTQGMKLMMVRFSVERQTPAPESLSDDDDAVCRITVVNKNGLSMDDTSYRGVEDGPSMGGCAFWDLGDGSSADWGDELSFQSQIVVAVTPDPVSSFTVEVEHMQDDAGDRWRSKLG